MLTDKLKPGDGQGESHRLLKGKAYRVRPWAARASSPASVVGFMVALDQSSSLPQKSQTFTFETPWPPGKRHPLGELCNLAYGQCNSPTDIVTLWEQCGPAVRIEIIVITAPEFRVFRMCQAQRQALSWASPHFMLPKRQREEITSVSPMDRLRHLRLG